MSLKISKRAVAGIAGILAFGSALVATGWAEAAPQTVEEIALYKGADRQAILEAGAKKEGAVMVYTTGSQTEPVMQSFRKAYPYINLQMYRAGSSDMARRIIEEYRANRHTFDVLDQNVASAVIVREFGILQPFYTPEMEHFEKDAIGPDNLWVSTGSSFLGLAWNTKEYAEADVPKTYDDLLDPKWKGKFAMSGRGSTIVHFAGSLALVKGEDYVRKLGQQDITVWQIGGRALSNLVVSGEIPISPAVYSAHMANSKRKGANVEWRALGPVQGNDGVASLNKHSPHPHAAMLLMDFFLNKEGMEFRKTLGYSIGRKDIVDRDKPKERMWLPIRPNYKEEYKTWSRLTTEAFGKGKSRPKK